MPLTVRLILKVPLFLAKYAFKHQENFMPIVKSIPFFNKKIRLSSAALLLIEYNNKYILIKNHHRPEYYAPIGGVYKHTGRKPAILDDIEWNSDYTHNESKEADMKNDLRGVIFGKRFPEFIDWFTSRKGRENEQCLYRELREELEEGKVDEITRDNSSKIKIELFRTVLEGPNKVKDREYHAQFRFFDIYKIDSTCKETNILVQELFKKASLRENNLILVSKEDILRGRLESDDKLIPGYTKYYFSSEWHGHIPTKY